MKDVNEAIIVQTSAKIAAELVAQVSGIKTTEDVIGEWRNAFDAVNDAIFAKVGLSSQRNPTPISSGRDVPVVTRERMIAGMEEVKQGRPVSGMKGKAESVQIAGRQHGDVPAWLNRAAAKAGVTKVWDNRDVATPENRRPWFVSADANKTGFWPPKKPSEVLTTDDIPF